MKKSHIIGILILAIIIANIIGYCEMTDAESGTDVYLTLVNKTHSLPENWEELVQIDTVFNSLDEENRIEHKTYEQFKLLRSELIENGVRIELDSVYRTVEEQQAIWNEWSNDPELGEEYCRKYLAVPGHSEHHTGLAVDIFIIKNGEEIRENDDMTADTKDFAKIHELLPKYGFILRYPEGKEDITGYAYEPWHLRYVDSVEIATEITNQGLTLEEYLNQT